MISYCADVDFMYNIRIVCIFMHAMHPESKEDTAMTKVFIDGSAGTTGLRIYDRLSQRSDIELMLLPEERRKDPAARADMLNAADIAFLCLPDAAAIEAVELVASPHTVIIDTSTAHRTADGWVYGMPELAGQREKIARSKRIANPGCHASGFVALVAPLVRAGVIAPDAALSCFSLTGYSGGGKKMIAEYQSDRRSLLLDAPRMYALGQTHKHLREMTAVCGLSQPPVFCPVVGDFYSGMEVVIPLFAAQTNGGMDAVCSAYQSAYPDGVIVFDGQADEDGFLSASAFADRDDMHIAVHGSAERITLTARFDNLGKGASGAAVQNMNIVLGVEETSGLNAGGTNA